VRRVGTDIQFSLEFYAREENANALGQVPVVVDWEPVEESLRFGVLRRGLCSAVEQANGMVSIQPVWHPKLGEPYLEGFQATWAGHNGHQLTLNFSTAYFQGMVPQATKTLVERGRLKEGDAVLYLVCAFRRPAQPQLPTPPEPARFAIEEILPEIPIVAKNMDDLLRGSVPYGQLLEADMPVFVPQTVLQEAVQRTREAGAVETGGILIGRLYRDSGLPEIFAEVTAQIPARYTQQALTSLTFTAQTWADVEAAITLRHGEEIYLGWWHSHPARQWCSKCPEENRKMCKLSGEFFSGHDAALHRTVFPRAYSVALVISDSFATGMTWPMFGWRDGVVAQRGFYITDSTMAPSSAAIPT
jgi:hypothetical protein